MTDKELAVKLWLDLANFHSNTEDILEGIPNRCLTIDWAKRYYSLLRMVQDLCEEISPLGDDWVPEGDSIEDPPLNTNP